MESLNHTKPEDLPVQNLSHKLKEFRKDKSSDGKWAVPFSSKFLLDIDHIPPRIAASIKEVVRFDGDSEYFPELKRRHGLYVFEQVNQFISIYKENDEFLVSLCGRQISVHSDLASAQSKVQEELYIIETAGRMNLLSKFFRVEMAIELEEFRIIRIYPRNDKVVAALGSKSPIASFDIESMTGCILNDRISKSSLPSPLVKSIEKWEMLVNVNVALLDREIQIALLG